MVQLETQARDISHSFPEGDSSLANCNLAKFLKFIPKSDQTLKTIKLVQNFHQSESSANYHHQLPKSSEHMHQLLLVSRNLQNKIRKLSEE
jgi:hypothetical protein